MNGGHRVTEMQMRFRLNKYTGTNNKNVDDYGLRVPHSLQVLHEWEGSRIEDDLPYRMR